MTAVSDLTFVPPLRVKGTALLSLGTGVANAPATVVEIRAASANRRPLLFVLGGPLGLSSLEVLGWLGGDKRAHGVASVADIVFIDPPGTGFGGALPASLWNIETDTRFQAGAIMAWLDRYAGKGREIHLLGLGMGGLRALKVAYHLQRKSPAASPRSLILLQTAINSALLACLPGNPIAYAMRLPTLAARTWQGRGVTISAGQMMDAESAALDRLFPALLQADRLSDTEVDRLGMSLRESFGEGAQALLRDGLEGRPISSPAILERGFAKPWLEERFGSGIAEPYVSSNPGIGENWDWRESGRRSTFSNLDLTSVLADVLTHSSSPDILSLTALLDLETPYLAARLPLLNAVQQERFACDAFASLKAPGMWLAKPIGIWLLDKGRRGSSFA